MKNELRIDNSIYMEYIDKLASQITEMNYGAYTYVESNEVGQVGELRFTEEAQDYYNEKYDEYDILIEDLISKLN